MSEKHSTRWMSEFLIIEPLADDLAADAADLAVAQSMVARRLRVIESVLTSVAERPADFRTPISDFFDQARVDSPMNAGGRSRTSWDSIQAPPTAFTSHPELDLSDDSYREMLATGGLGTVSDLTLHSTILAYYRTAEDMGDSVRRAAECQGRFEDALSWLGLAIGDPFNLSEMQSRADREPRLHVELRHARTPSAPTRLRSKTTSSWSAVTRATPLWPSPTWRVTALERT